MKIAFQTEPTVTSTKIIRDITNTFLSNLIACEDIEKILLALSEATTNCVVHAKTAYNVDLEVNDAHISITVKDYGNNPFDGNSYEPPPPGSEEGKLGVKTIKGLMDEAIWHLDNGTKVCMKTYTKHNLLKNKPLYSSATA